MTPDELVERLFAAVMEPASREVEFFSDPPGRAPALDFQAVAEFIRGLDADQHRTLESFVQLVAARALMNVLYSLDGVHPILDDLENHHFELALVGPNGRSEMLPPAGPGELGDFARALETTRRGGR